MKKTRRFFLFSALSLACALLFLTGVAHAQTAVDTALQNTTADFLPVLQKLPWWAKISGALTVISELLAFIPVPVNGVLQGLFLGIKAIISGSQGKKTS